MWFKDMIREVRVLEWWYKWYKWRFGGALAGMHSATTRATQRTLTLPRNHALPAFTGNWLVNCKFFMSFICFIVYYKTNKLQKQLAIHQSVACKFRRGRGFLEKWECVDYSWSEKVCCEAGSLVWCWRGLKKLLMKSWKGFLDCSATLPLFMHECYYWFIRNHKFFI